MPAWPLTCEMAMANEVHATAYIDSRKAGSIQLRMTTPMKLYRAKTSNKKWKWIER